MSESLDIVVDDTFQEKVREADGVVVVVFTGAWCQPCKRYKPIVASHAIGNEIKFYEADVEFNEKRASEFNIRTLPSSVLFVNGMIRDVHAGSMSQNDLRLWLQENV